MSNVFGAAFGWLGLLTLLHAAYSLKQYKKIVSFAVAEVKLAAPTLPVDVIVELLIAFFLIMLGQMISLKLKKIRITTSTKAKSYEESFNNSDFMVFNNRGTHISKRSHAHE
jgi:hypothetical protein